MAEWHLYEDAKTYSRLAIWRTRQGLGGGGGAGRKIATSARREIIDEVANQVARLQAD